QGEDDEGETGVKGSGHSLWACKSEASSTAPEPSSPLLLPRGPLRSVPLPADADLIGERLERSGDDRRDVDRQPSPWCAVASGRTFSPRSSPRPTRFSSGPPRGLTSTTPKPNPPTRLTRSVSQYCAAGPPTPAMLAPKSRLSRSSNGPKLTPTNLNASAVRSLRKPPSIRFRPPSPPWCALSPWSGTM